MRKCACFVGCPDAHGLEMKVRGTGFFVAKKLSDDIWRAYCITAAHTIERIHSLGRSHVGVRLNRRDGGVEWMGYPIDGCVTHPGGADVALIPGGIQLETYDHIAWPLEKSVTDQVLESYSVGSGDEVFITGLFLNHHGAQRNLPIVRVGHIAAMPEEPVNTPRGPMEAYLIELRSMSGLSGSPVFLMMDPWRQPKAPAPEHGIRAPLFLLGLMHGHYASLGAPPETDALEEDSATTVDVKSVNIGIGIATPVKAIIELLELPRFVAEEQEIIRDWKPGPP